MDILTVRVPSRYRESRRPAFSAPPLPPDVLSLDRARAAEGAELGESCGVCGLTFHPDCAMCAGRAA